MSKIYIIGNITSRKTTFARRLSKKMNIPFYEMDSIIHDDVNKIKRNLDEQKQIINEINKDNDWIIEGMGRDVGQVVFSLADKIIFLDTPIYICKYRILSRFIKQKLKIEKCNYTPDFRMLKLMYKWMNNFKNNRNKLEDSLKPYKEKIKFVKNI